MNEEKPKYGWYVKGLIIGFTTMGLIGLTLIILGFIFEAWLKYLLVIIGLMIVLLFLWPGLGIAIMNLILNRTDDSELEMEVLNFIESPKILDVGCGTGRTAIKLAKSLKNGGHLYGIDIYNKAAIGGNALERIQKNAQIEGVQNKTTFQYGSAIEIPFNDEIFDIVNFSSVLHELHMEAGPDKALNEAYRVLKPEGYLFVGEWNRNARQLIAYCGIFCFVFKPQNYWYKLIEKHGFEVIKHHQKGGFSLFSAIKKSSASTTK